MYKSPIEIKLNDIVSDAVGKADEYIVSFVQQVGVNVDKDELIKALKFNREQYEKGWNDRDYEIVRCKDCWNSLVIPKEMQNYAERYCEVWCAEMNDDDYCSCGKRREER